jgi:hypothetical protein
MNGFAVVATGTVTGEKVNTVREWREDEKDALYRGAELAEVFPTVFIFNAFATGRALGNGKPAIHRFIDGQLIEG